MKVLEARDDDAVVVTVFCDDNKKYLSTDLLREEPVRSGYLSPDVRLTGFDVFKRVCITCWEPTGRARDDHPVVDRRAPVSSSSSKSISIARTRWGLAVRMKVAS